MSGIGFKQNSEVAKDSLGHKLAFPVGYRLSHSAQTCYYNKVSTGLTCERLPFSHSVNEYLSA